MDSSTHSARGEPNAFGGATPGRRTARGPTSGLPGTAYRAWNLPDGSFRTWPKDARPAIPPPARVASVSLETTNPFLNVHQRTACERVYMQVRRPFVHLSSTRFTQAFKGSSPFAGTHQFGSERRNQDPCQTRARSSRRSIGVSRGRDPDVIAVCRPIRAGVTPYGAERWQPARPGRQPAGPVRPRRSSAGSRTPPHRRP